jgi:4-amino-4-deoxy-L-arabinose transferase-like glycosyltransferase
MTVELFTLVAALSAIAWVPILIKFLRAWLTRRNPVSLAICLVIAFIIYTDVITLSVYAFSGNPTWSFAAICGLNMVVCCNFYFSIRWADKTFRDKREK